MMKKLTNSILPMDSDSPLNMKISSTPTCFGIKKVLPFKENEERDKIIKSLRLFVYNLNKKLWKDAQYLTDIIKKWNLDTKARCLKGRRNYDYLKSINPLHVQGIGEFDFPYTKRLRFPDNKYLIFYNLKNKSKFKKYRTDGFIAIPSIITSVRITDPLHGNTSTIDLLKWKGQMHFDKLIKKSFHGKKARQEKRNIHDDTVNRTYEFLSKDSIVLVKGENVAVRMHDVHRRIVTAFQVLPGFNGFPPLIVNIRRWRHKLIISKKHTSSLESKTINIKNTILIQNRRNAFIKKANKLQLEANNNAIRSILTTPMIGTHVRLDKGVQTNNGIEMRSFTTSAVNDLLSNDDSRENIVYIPVFKKDIFNGTRFNWQYNDSPSINIQENSSIQDFHSIGDKRKRIESTHQTGNLVEPSRKRRRFETSK